ncbi:hypothetical protein DFJ74DRAFT_665813 [Hyaloraphidium curvatum]|nr:hypothetical protein DFJ74DRAFT_665813 [Hyaloraphidium curvatum]
MDQASLAAGEPAARAVAFEVPLEGLTTPARKPKLAATVPIETSPADVAAKLARAAERKKMLDATTAARAHVSATRAHDVSQFAKRTAELGAVERLQGILSKMQLVEIKRVEEQQSRLEKIKKHNEAVAVRKAAALADSLAPGLDDIESKQQAAASRRDALQNVKREELAKHWRDVEERKERAKLGAPSSPAQIVKQLDAAAARRASFEGARVANIRAHLEVVQQRRRKSTVRQDSSSTLDGLPEECAGSISKSSVDAVEGSSSSATVAQP